MSFIKGKDFGIARWCGVFGRSSEWTNPIRGWELLGCHRALPIITGDSGDYHYTYSPVTYRSESMNTVWENGSNLAKFACTSRLILFAQLARGVDATMVTCV